MPVSCAACSLSLHSSAAARRIAQPSVGTRSCGGCLWALALCREPSAVQTSMMQPHGGHTSKNEVPFSSVRLVNTSSGSFPAMARLQHTAGRLGAGCSTDRHRPHVRQRVMGATRAQHSCALRGRQRHSTRPRKSQLAMCGVLPPLLRRRRGDARCAARHGRVVELPRMDARDIGDVKDMEGGGGGGVPSACHAQITLRAVWQPSCSSTLSPPLE